MRDADGKSKQFGFVCFKNPEDAQKALDHFVADKENTRKLYVCEAKSKLQRKAELERSAYLFKRSMQMLNLIVRNVDPETTKEEFETFFGNFGEIRSSKLIPEASMGFVCFTEREAARMAKENQNLIPRNRTLNISYCEPKESRQKKQEAIWDRRVYDKTKASQYQSSN